MKVSASNAIQEEKFLLATDERSIAFQWDVIYEMQQHISKIIEQFNALNLGIEFPLQVVESLGWQAKKGVHEVIIKQIVLPTIVNPKVAGRKTSPEKVYELMDLNLSGFAWAWGEASDTLVRIQQRAASSGVKYSFKASFYELTDGEKLEVNRTVYDEWIENNCRKYTENDEQVRVYKIVSAITDSLNELKRTCNENKSTAISNLQRNPNFYVQGWMGRLIQYSYTDNKFIVNPEFISHH